MLKENLIKGLNEDLAADLDTVIRYNYEVGKLFSLMGKELRELFTAEITDVLGQARELLRLLKCL